MKKKSQFRSGRGATRFGHPQPLQSFSRTRSLELASTFSQALALHQAGRLAEAEKIYGQILKVQPNHFDSLHLVGVIYAQRGNHVESVRQIDLALKINPKAAYAHHNRGLALQELKRLDDALASYDKAIALKPDYAEAFNNRGLALRELKRLDQALASYDKAIALKPDSAEAFSNRGVALRELRRLDEALASYDKAIALKPDYAEAFNYRGNALQALNRLDDALASYAPAIAYKFDYAEAFNNRGIILRDQQRLDDALASYDKAIALKPDYAEAQFALCMAELPILYENEPEITVRRTAYERRLNALCEAGDRSTNLADLAKGVGSSQPFLLAYQGYNDRDLQALYGSFVCRVMAKRYPPAALATPPGETEPVRAWASSADFSGSIPIGSFRSKAGSASWIVGGSEHSAITPETKRMARQRWQPLFAIVLSRVPYHSIAGDKRSWPMPPMS